MPNTLAHLGIQGLLSRTSTRVDPRWILLGCIVPDVPWIANRALLGVFPQIDAHGLRLYVIAQASLLCSLLLCGALAALAARWRAVFAVLAANAFLHLLLDACQTKWGNGVHLIAPASWRPWNLELFWPESAPTYGLTALGLGFALWALRFARRHPMRPVRPPRQRAAAFAGLLAAYLILPALLMRGPERADSHSVRTLHERSQRTGRAVALDRVWLQRLADGRSVVVLGGGEVELRGAVPDHSARISARGHFLDPGTLLVEESHEHAGWPRDIASYVGLALVAAAWLAGWSAGVSPPSRRGPSPVARAGSARGA